MKKYIATIVAILMVATAMPAMGATTPSTYTTEISDGDIYVLPISDVTNTKNNNYTDEDIEDLIGYAPDDSDDEFAMQILNETGVYVACTVTVHDDYINITAFGGVTELNFTAAKCQIRYRVESDDDWTEVLAVNATPSKSKSWFIVTLPGTNTIKIGDYYYKWCDACDDTNNISVMLQDKKLADLNADDATQIKNYSKSGNIYTFNMTDGMSHQILVTNKASTFSSAKTTVTTKFVDPIIDNWYPNILQTKTTATVTTEEVASGVNIYEGDEMLFKTYEDGSGYWFWGKFWSEKVVIKFNGTDGLSTVTTSYTKVNSLNAVSVHEIVVFDTVHYSLIEEITYKYTRNFYGVITNEGEAETVTGYLSRFQFGNEKTPMAVLEV